MGIKWEIVRLIFLVVSLQCSALASKHLCFSIIGDTGGLPNPPYHTMQQTRTASLLTKITKHFKCRFVVGLGDNFYFNGVKDVNDPRFRQTFENTYRAVNVPWYMIAGNHDHLSNVSAQVQYTKFSNRWKYPDYYYTQIMKVPGTKKTVQLVMLDTQMLCYHNRKTGIPPPAIQLKWATDTLSQSRADYLLVGGHHPIHSTGPHGSNKCLREKLMPLLENNHVTAYFSGHDHNLQHVKPVDSSVHYFVSGSGNFVDPRLPNLLNVPKDSLRFRHGTFGGLIFMNASENFLQATMLNNQPKKLYTVKLLPRNIYSKHTTKRNMEGDALSNHKHHKMPNLEVPVIASPLNPSSAVEVLETKHISKENFLVYEGVYEEKRTRYRFVGKQSESNTLLRFTLPKQTGFLKQSSRVT